MNEKVMKNLKVLREQCGFNQAQIAKFIGVDQSYISKIENGERKITVDMLEKLCTLYGVALSDIHGDNIDETRGMRIAFRTSSLKDSDLNVILNVRKIALYLQEMNQLIKEGRENE